MEEAVTFPTEKKKNLDGRLPMTVRDKRYISNHVVKSYFLREEMILPPHSFNNPRVTY